MHVLIVGGSGFVGRALTARLMAAGHAVEVWDRQPVPAFSGSTFRAVDLLGGEDLPTPQGKPWDAAFHFAAFSVPGMLWTPERVMDNLRMTARVFDHLALAAPGCKAIFASSSFVYARSAVPLTETSALYAHHPYALSKHLGELWALSHRDELKVHLVRPFNLIGPGMATGLLVPDLLDRIHHGEDPIRMRGRDDIRDFLDWRDAVEAYVHLLDTDAPSGSAWNLCSGRPTRVSELVHALLRAHGIDHEVHFQDPGVTSMLGDPTHLMQATGWRPRYTLEETAQAIAQAR
jgi:nucleoside-diphosphate-sugar epimerase